MSDLRVLTDAELEIVSGGSKIERPQPVGSGRCGGEIKVVEEVLVDILKLLEPQRQKQVAYL
jgi:hypothetical protein